MRIATFSVDGAARAGLVRGDRILDLGAAWAALGKGKAPSVLDIVRNGLQAEVAAVGEAAPAEAWRDLAGIRLLAPIPRPAKNVFCIGRNYKLHIEEGARARGREVSFPPVPEVFTKAPTTVIGHEDDIPLPANTQQLDYEVELAFVVGRDVKDISVADALDAIFGYTILNDVTARDLQVAHGQWFKGKSLDGTCPIGPWIVTADEFGPPAGHRIALKVNGEQRQDSDTSDMLFDCAQILASLSEGMTVEAGDIVTTGTPSGVALGMTPPPWLKDGDLIEAEIEGIGVLRNRVRAAAA